MATMYMRIGPNLGRVLLEKTQQLIEEGKPDKAIQTYIDGLNGFTKEYAIMVLKNEAVLVTDEDGININLTDDKEYILENKENIWDWTHIINNKIDEMMEIKEAIWTTRRKFQEYISNTDIEGYDIYALMERFFDKEDIMHLGYHNIAAKLIGGGRFNNQASNGEDLWNRLCSKVESDECKRWEAALYYTVEYGKLIRELHKEYKKFEPTYLFLVENGMMERWPFIESTIEITLEILAGYADPKKGYKHSMCNEGLLEYKAKLRKDLESWTYGKEYLENGILKKNLLDKYEAGWLSPEGDFYGKMVGNLIHVDIATQLYKGNGPVAKAMAEDGVSELFSGENPDRWLEKKGWVKVHGQDCYGSFIGISEYKRCPNPIQIKMICEYADKFYGGMFYTEPDAFGRVRHTEPVSTYKVKQMDEFALHKIFSL